MKIALLGAKEAGKTTYFAGLFANHTHNIVLPTLDDYERETLRKAGVTHQVGFQFQGHGAMARKLEQSAKGLTGDAPTFPERTERFDALTLSASFQFRHLPGGRTTTFRRTLTVVDHAGGALTQTASDSQAVLRELDTADCFIAFIDARVALDGDPKAKNELLALGAIDELIGNLRTRLDEFDVVPIVFVVSKFDLVANDPVKFKRLQAYIHDELVGPYSEKWGNVAIFVCPVSVLEPGEGGFEPFNLQWPFLFGAGSILLRNSLLLDAQARRERAAARDMASEADERERMRRERPLSRFFQWINEDFKTSNHWRREAQNYYAEAQRSVEMSADDRQLARSLWRTIAEYEDLIGAKTFLNGEPINIVEAIAA